MGAARTLPWSWYADPDVLRREPERIFRRTWQYVGHAGRVESMGDRFSAWAGEVPVLVERDEDGPRAFLSVLPPPRLAARRGRGQRQVGAVPGGAEGVRSGVVQSRLLGESEQLVARF